MKLIDADALKANVPNTNVDIFENCRNCSTLMDWEVKELIDKMPTIDAVEVVRCKDCKYNKGTKVWLDGDVTIDCDNGMGYPPPDWFCADGERREEP